MTAPAACDPAWPDIYQPDDQPPSVFICRLAEIADLQGQGPGPVALWTARTLDTGSYL
ncbi:hypothetical protein [Streptomyces turgidiscabies]|uniref:hypothetical protein n=1 Tax=Streptomyces turgidiscabies TaxID=85558 RepID=UPI0038F779E5